MNPDLGALSVAAVSAGFLHCLAGPDHYVPFVAMSRVGRWSLRKTLWVTFFCGVGHVASSAVLGFIGLALGIVVLQLEALESVRGDLACWLLIAFGAAYSLFGLYYARRARRKLAADQEPAAEDAVSQAEQLALRAGGMAPWILFLIFLFGPCEVLIPFLMYPAAEGDLWGAVWVTALFCVTTLSTMIALVAIIYLGAATVRVGWVQTYGHALAGATVLACGLAIMFGL